MKKLFAILAVALCSVVSVAHAQLKQGPEYVWRAQVADFSWANTLTTPSLVAFPITAFFQYDIQSGASIQHFDSGPNLVAPKPSQLTVDLLATPTATVTFTYGGKSVTLEYGAVVAAFAQLIVDQRNAQLSKP